MGFMYANGVGVPVNYLAAYVWFSVAAAQGNEGARTARDEVAEMLTLELRARGQVLAKRCFESQGKDCD